MDLPEAHPDIYSKFLDGNHVVRRSERYWAGLSSDLIIEQVLMRSMKSSGGLTRGRGLTEAQRLLWTMAMPACAEINEGFQELTGVKYNTSEQHKSISKSMQNCDTKDTCSIMQYIMHHNPSHDNPCLQSISTGVVAADNINADCAKQVGEKIIKSIVGKNKTNITFKRKEQVVTLANSVIQIDNESINIDPQLLFQCLVSIRDRYEDTEELFSYELCSYPASLFNTSLLPREARKPELTNTLWEKLEIDSAPSEYVTYVLDGGALVQRIPWNRGQTFEAILDTYVDYERNRYNEPKIAFDGYEGGASIKDPTHQRRSSGHKGVAVNFTCDMVLTYTKE